MTHPEIACGLPPHNPGVPIHRSIAHPRPVSTVRAMGLGRLGGWIVGASRPEGAGGVGAAGGRQGPHRALRHRQYVRAVVALDRDVRHPSSSPPWLISEK